jgi:hypothetical protein
VKHTPAAETKPFCPECSPHVGAAYYAVHVGAAQVVAREGATVSVFDGVTTKLEMCPQRLVNRDGDVSSTKDRDGIDPRDLLKFEQCPIGVSNSTLQLWSHSCTV